MIAKRIRHKGICDHAQTPYARRKCRAAKLAAVKAAEEAKMETPNYQAGDEIDINGTVIILGKRKGNTGVRWTWIAPALDVTGMAYYTTPEAAIEDASRKLAAERCACGAVAEMTGSTRRVCANCI